MNYGKYIILVGSMIVVIGVIVYFFPGAFKWLGRLPGDIRVENGKTRFYFPVVTMVVVSVVLTIVFNLIKRFF